MDRARHKLGADPPHVEVAAAAHELRAVDHQRDAALAALGADRLEVDERAVAPVAGRQRTDGNAVEAREHRRRPIVVRRPRHDHQLAARRGAQRLPRHHVGRHLVGEHEHAAPLRADPMAQIVRRERHRVRAARRQADVLRARADQRGEERADRVKVGRRVANVHGECARLRRRETGREGWEGAGCGPRR